MNTPLILTNTKNYPSATGEALFHLAKIHAELSEETGITLAMAISALDIETISRKVALPFFGQHADALSFGASTGGIVPEILRQKGAVGTLLNHSEKRFPHIHLLQQAAEECRKSGLILIICAENMEEAQEISRTIRPEFVALEPPELIGGEISITSARPELISETVAKLKSQKILVGAGIKTGADVEAALLGGAAGVLLASGVMKAPDPKMTLKDLAAGAKRGKTQ